MNKLQYNLINRGGPTKLAAMFAVVLMSSQISACKTTGSVVTNVDCEIFQPVKWSKKDTLRTVEQIKEHNAVWRSICQ